MEKLSKRNSKATIVEKKEKLVVFSNEVGRCSNGIIYELFQRTLQFLIHLTDYHVNVTLVDERWSFTNIRVFN